MSGSAGQDRTAADIGDEADAAFGHRDHRPVGDDPVAAMGGDTDAAAHHDPVHQGDPRHRQFGDLAVEPVLLRPEAPSIGEIAALAGPVEIRDVAAGAERLFALGVDHDGIDGVAAGPVVDRRLDGQSHVMGQRVQGLRPRQGDAADPA